ncbi:MAG: diguanylate cyclase, partial [Deltaproteobacteria bacterium]|nr:diguanylate cyclase [Deltaproteobacteria bacterium]
MSTTILLVDDTDALRGEMRRILEEADLDVRIVEASDGAQALPLALSGDVDIVLSDIVMPSLDGISMLRSIRQHRDVGNLPVILVTSQSEQETRGLSFEVGASDYLSRPFSPAELVTRVQVQLRLRELQRELQRANERHRQLNQIDELTGVANRRQFTELCRKELARTRRHELSLAVAMLDIDDLRGINTRAGHRAGDALITEVAGVIQRQMRAADVLARFDSGRFALLLPHADGAQAAGVVERMRELVAG